MVNYRKLDKGVLPKMWLSTGWVGFERNQRLHHQHPQKRLAVGESYQLPV